MRLPMKPAVIEVGGGYVLDQILNTNYADPTFTLEAGAEYLVIMVCGWGNNGYNAQTILGITSISNVENIQEYVTPYTGRTYSSGTAIYVYSGITFKTTGTSVTFDMSFNPTTLLNRSFLVFKKL